MIITTTGFFNTGSSAIIHLLKEFDAINSQDEVYEVRFLYDPDCISDLEYHLIENPHRQNTSYAIQRFKKYIDFNTNPILNHHYEKICKGNFKKLSYKYIDDISLFKYYGVSHIDTFDKSVVFCFFNRCYQKVLRLFLGFGIKNRFNESLLPENTVQYAGLYEKDRFIEITRNYVKSVLRYFNPKGDDYFLIDQLVPPSNIGRYLNYLPEKDVRVFVVDRDPRDLYVTCKYFLNSKAIPVENVKQFCDWYEWTRGQSKVKEDPECVMRIQFEDLIYDYEATRQRIIDFCAIEKMNCSKKGEIFIPENSINNTQVWLRFPESKEDVEYIFNRLNKYCYDFDSKIKKPNFAGKMFDC